MFISSVYNVLLHGGPKEEDAYGLYKLLSNCLVFTNGFCGNQGNRRRAERLEYISKNIPSDAQFVPYVQ